MAIEHICPWYVGYIIDNPLRYLVQQPRRMLEPHIQPGMTVLDIGCGMGIFTRAMARMVGDGGRVVAVDLQQKMLDVLMKRARRDGTSHRVHPHACEANRLGIDEQADFGIACAMVHEVPDKDRLFREILASLKPGATFLVLEPAGHVTRKAMDETARVAEDAGFRVQQRNKTWTLHHMLLSRPA